MFLGVIGIEWWLFLGVIGVDCDWYEEVFNLDKFIVDYIGLKVKVR